MDRDDPGPLNAQLQRIRSLHFLTAQITGLASPAQVLQQTIDTARDLVRADLGVIVRLDPRQSTPVDVYPSNYPMDRIPPGVEIQGRGILGRVLGGETVVTTDVSSEAGFTGLPSWHPDLGPIIAVPVKDRNSMTAVLLVGRSPGRPPFEPVDVELVKTIANLVGVALRVSYQVSQLEELNRRLVTLAATDVLTGLGNRRGFEEAVAAAHSAGVRYLVPYSVLMADIDHFKHYNDRFGHPSGDRALALVASCLRNCIRAPDGVFRYGGEEIVFVLPHQRALHLSTVAERLRLAVQDLRIDHPDSEAGVLTLSIGGAVFDPGVTRAGEKGWEEVLKEADEALYAAKREGRNRSVIHY